MYTVELHDRKKQHFHDKRAAFAAFLVGTGHRFEIRRQEHSLGLIHQIWRSARPIWHPTGPGEMLAVLSAYHIAKDGHMADDDPELWYSIAQNYIQLGPAKIGLDRLDVGWRAIA